MAARTSTTGTHDHLTVEGCPCPCVSPVLVRFTQALLAHSWDDASDRQIPRHPRRGRQNQASTLPCPALAPQRPRLVVRCQPRALAPDLWRLERHATRDCSRVPRFCIPWPCGNRQRRSCVARGPSLIVPRGTRRTASLIVRTTQLCQGTFPCRPCRGSISPSRRANSSFTDLRLDWPAGARGLVRTLMKSGCTRAGVGCPVGR